MGEGLISVIIPSYRPDGRLRDCLESILGGGGRLAFEVWLVDSTPGGVAGLVGGFLEDGRFHLLASPRRLLPGEARDLGAERSGGEVLAFTDADCVAGEGWLEGLVGALEESGAGACGGSVENATPSSYFGTAVYLSEFGAFTPRNPARRDRFVPSCNLALRREVWSGAGGFPAGKATGEDVALGRRVTDLGLEVAFVPGPVVHHQNNTGARDFLMKQWRLGRGCAVNFREGIQPFSFMDERRWTAGLLLAAVFPGRLLRIGWRSLRNREVGPLRLAALFPALAAGAACYAAGFTAAYAKAGKLGRRRRGAGSWR